jgi:hypothetical protein
MSLRKWKRTALVLCAACLLLTGCTAEDELTPSGSNAWSRGVILGTTAGDPAAVAVWEDTTFVAWAAENGQLQLAQLDDALTLQNVTALTLTAAYPYEVYLEAESAELLHLVWVDSIEGVRTIIHAQIAPDEAEPSFRQEIRLPDAAYHIEPVVRSEAGRLEIFWSAEDHHNSGIYHRAVGLTDGEASPDARLTETGWQPGVARGPAGVTNVAWLEEGRSGYITIWHARFDPQSQSLDRAALATEVRVKRGQRLEGPAVGSAGTQTVVAWTIGRRFSAGLGTDLDVPTAEKDIGAGLARVRGVAHGITSDKGQYVMVPSTPAEMTPSVRALTSGEVIEIWKRPRMRTMGDRTWAFFSSWVAQRSDVRMQVVVVPLDKGGPGDPAIISKTRPASTSPDLAVSADGTLRATWVEPLGNDVCRVVVASTAASARDALGGFRPAEWLGEVAAFVFENLSLLGYVPMVLFWVVLPLGVVLGGTIWRPGGMQRWQATAWLGAAVLIHLTCKRLIAPGLMPLGPGSVQLAFSVLPVVLGISLMWIYWRWAREPLLLAAYGLFAGVDAAFSLFIMLPRLLWVT